MLKLTDLLTLSGIELGQFKIHCATSESSPPLTAYLNGNFKQWQEYQNKRNFPCDTIISLIGLGGDKWLFVGVWRVLGVTPRSNALKTWYEYSTEEVSGLDHLSGKTIISFRREFRSSYIRGDRYAQSVLISQLLPERMTIGDFPGYSSLVLTYDQLRHVVTRDLVSWRTALRSVAGIYLITDTSCGKQYVGSAYGVDGIGEDGAFT